MSEIVKQLRQKLADAFPDVPVYGDEGERTYGKYHREAAEVIARYAAAWNVDIETAIERIMAGRTNPAAVHHEGEIEVDVYWEYGELRVKIDSAAFADMLSPIVEPLADPTKPVRVRLKMSAERMDE